MFSLKKKFKILLVFLIVVTIVGGCVFSKNMSKMRKAIYINSILSQKSYSYLPNDAKDYIKKIYEDTGEVILTEKNKEDNKPYLNPDYIEYLELSEKEKEKVDLVPEAYILDYSINQTYGNSELPSTFDLRNRNGHNFLSPIKNQGSTSICWAFASIENVETLYMKNNNQSYSDLVPKFSIRQMDYITSTRYDSSSSHSYLALEGNWNSGMCTYSSGCSWTPWENAGNGSHELDKGGNFFTSSIAMANGITLTDESVMPWHEEKKPVFVNDIYGYDKSLYEVNSTIQMPTINEDSASDELINSYVNEVKTYMMEYGGPFVGTYSPKSSCGFQNVDGSKVLKTDDCVSNSNNKDLGHAMQIIGWDDEYEYSYCESGTTHKSVNSNGTCSTGKLTTGKGAWILRNSWGTETKETQEYSYVYLTYDSTRLSIGFTTSISEMQNRIWDNNYHSNPWIERKVSNGMASVENQTKEFNTHNDNSEKIEKIKFLTSSKNGTYNISILTDNKNYNNVVTVTTTEAGIYTIDLSTKNIIIDNKVFSVKIEGQNEAQFMNDSISVFTSNTSDEPLLETNYISGIKTYEDPDGKPSKENVAFVSSHGDTIVKLEHYIKNISDYKKISYKVFLDGVEYNNYFFNNYNNISSKMIHVDGLVSTTLDISKEKYSDVAVCGKVYTFQILYDNVVIESFPLKRICANWDNSGTDYTKSKIRFHKNDGSGYYSTITKADTTSFNIMKSDGTGNAYIGDESKFFQYDRYIKSWNTKPDGTGVTYTDNDYFVYKDADLYAQWSNPETEPHKYRINWECNRYICHETQIVSKSTEVTFNKEFVIPNNTFTNLTDGQEFIYWAFYSSNESKDIYYEEEKAMNITEYGFNSPYNNGETEYLSAVWSDSYHSVTFDANHGTGSMKGIKVINDKTARLKYNLFERQGYSFIGWNTNADGTGISYTDGQDISLTDDITLYAQWKKISVSITTDVSDIDYGTVETNFPNHITKNVTLTNNGSVPVSLSLKNPTGDGPFGSMGFSNGKQLQPGETYSLVLIANSSSPFASIAWSYSGKYIITATEVGGERKATAEVTSEIKLIPPFKVKYQAHIQNVGWQEYKENGATAGAIGQSKRLEGIKIKLENAPYSGDIEYSTHVENIGWMDFVKNDEMSGTSGRALRIEAIKIKLTGIISNYYDVYYRVNCESFGWLGWARNGEQAGSSGYAYRLEGIEIKLIPKGETFDRGGEAFKRPEPSKVIYKTHVQEFGWQTDVCDGKTSGTVGQAKRLEGIKIKLSDELNGDINYSTHVQNIGWMDFVKNGEMSGTSGKALRLEAIKINLSGEVSNEYDVYYRVHAERFGWLGWAKNGEQAGSSGYAYRLEGIEIKLIPKGENFDRGGEPFKKPESPKVIYKTHVQEFGWQNDVSDGMLSGTAGQAKRLEGIKIKLSDELNGDISYSTHVQNIGWMNYVKNGEMSGTSGRALRLEAIKIRLSGQVSEEYDVYYRVHAERFGWLGWAKNDEMAGTSGYGYRLEAIEIKLVKKGESISSGNSFISR